MIEDLAKASGSMVRRGDLAIIGTGPAGITLALECAKLGISVILIESGGMKQDAKLQDAVESHSFDPERHAPLEMTHLRQVGGTSNIWGGRSLPFEPMDFITRPIAGNVEWPVSYDDLSPYFAKACKWLECGRPIFTAGEISSLTPTMFAGAPDGDVTTSSLERWSFPLSFKQAYLQELTRNPNIQLITGLTCTEIETQPESSSASAALCRNLVGGDARIEAKTFVVAAGGIESTRILLSSRGPSGGALGDESGNLGHWYLAHTQGVIADIVFRQPPDSGVDFARDLDGSYVRRRFSFSEKFQAAENLPNIVAWIDNPEIADAAHHSGELSAVYLTLRSPLGKLIAPDAQRLSITGTYIPGTPYGGAKKSPTSEHLRNIFQHPIKTASFLATFGSRRLLARGRKAPGFLVRNNQTTFPFEFQGEHQPNFNSTVSLSHERDTFGMRRVSIDLRFSDDDVDGVLRAHTHWDQFLRFHNIGHLKYLSDNPRGDVSRRLGGGFHQAGTTRMSKSPRDGVVDENLKIHGVTNVYVASSSTFVTSSHANPTFMIVAFAARLAEHLSTTTLLRRR
jgi:choline dehydrogenase-like flavoprotein